MKDVEANTYIEFFNTMKHTITLLSIVFIVLVSVLSCSQNTDFTSSPITFKGVALSSSSKIGTVAFTSYDIKSFNGTTGEICFIDSKTGSKLREYDKLNCYLGEDSLFTVNITSDIMSSTVNDLVLNLNNNDTYYFADGYPASIDNLGATTLRSQNKAKRTTSWAIFIAVIKTEQKYNE